MHMYVYLTSVLFPFSKLCPSFMHIIIVSFRPTVVAAVILVIIVVAVVALLFLLFDVVVFAVNVVIAVAVFLYFFLS